MAKLSARIWFSLLFLISVTPGVVSAGAGFGCGAAEERPEGPDDYDVALDQARGKDTKTDQVVSCGDVSCGISLCGYDCTEAGVLCGDHCASTDRRAEAFVEFTSTGDHASNRDSRDIPYEPVLRLDNALFYGCELWDFTNSNRQGLELSYSEIFQGAFAAGDPRDHGYEFEVYAAPFSGPGTYPASGFLSKNSTARANRDYYYGKSACTLTVEADGDGIVGSFRCPQVPHRTDSTRSIALNGTFSCGANALDTNIIALPGE